MKKGTVDEIVAEDRCCGCGVCATGCPTDAISMVFSSDQEHQPVVDPETCIECPICLRICPFDEKNLAHQCQEAVTGGPAYGVPDSSWIFRGYQRDEALYSQSASGGLLSALQSFLLDEKLVDCVIHAQPEFARSEELFFRASISRNATEIESKKSSFYYPIEFSRVLEDVVSDASVNRVCFTGIPCAVSGVENLGRVLKKLRTKMWCKLSVVCGHSVSGQFAQAVAAAYPERDEGRKIDFRGKHGITEASDFNTEIHYEGGQSVRQSRFQSPFTRNWRTYSYALNACFSCPDFWGAKADASFKDAWGFSEGERPQGESVVVVRTERVRDALREMARRGLVHLETVDRSKAMLSQWESVEFKALDIRHRIDPGIRAGLKSPVDSGWLDRWLHGLGYRLKRWNMRFSKRLLREKGRTVPAWLSRLLAGILWWTNGAKRALTKWREVTRLDGPGLSVVYTAGFGYGNLGDEAQLHSNLSLWRELAPGSRVTVLSPRPVYTRRTHPGTEVIPASRRTFWALGGVEYFGLGRSPMFLLPFFLKYFFVRANALLLRWLGLTVMMSPHSAGLLQRLREADVLHIGGGGFLTGRTPSRLYDTMALIRIARSLGTDVILTGQTVGIWQNPVQKWMARQLRLAEQIGVRDPERSSADLRAVGVDPKRIQVAYDDALFCPARSEEEWSAYARDAGIEPRQGILTVHVHDWEVERSRVDRALDRMAEDLAKAVRRHELSIVYVPMVASDRDAIERLDRRLGRIGHVLEARDDFRLVISAFRAARVCVTMKHHPIVFSLGGAVPTIAVHLDEYYRHKNLGALELFGQGRFALDDGELAAGALARRLDEILGSEGELRRTLERRLDELRPQRGEVLREVLRARGMMGDGWEDWEEVDVSSLRVAGF